MRDDKGVLGDGELPIIFIHINKTAGSSITTALRLPFEHKTAIEKREEVGQRLWESAFKFTFVRNPWDKVVSHYFYRVQTKQTGMGDRHISFRDWVRAAYGDRDPRYYDNPRMFMPQCDWIADLEGRLLVDFVGRFETLEADFRCILELINSERQVCLPRKLPHMKRSFHGPYEDYYDEETSEIVRERFAGDLARFQYSWEGPRVSASVPGTSG